MNSENVFRHGIYVNELLTELTPLINAASPTVVVGTTPIHAATSPAPVNVPILCNNLAEFVTQFGWSNDLSRATVRL